MILVIAEHNGGQVHRATWEAVAAAQSLGQPVTIVVAGHDMPDDAHLALRSIGYVPEQVHLYPGVSVAETLAYHSAFYSTWDAAYAARTLDAFDLRPGTAGQMGELFQLILRLPAFVAAQHNADEQRGFGGRSDVFQ